MLHFLWARSHVLRQILRNRGEKKGEMMILTASVWSEGGKEVPPESPMRQADMAGSSGTMTPSFSPLPFPLFSLLLLFCALPPLCTFFFSAPAVFFCTSLICFILSCTVLCLILLFTVLFYCPQLNKGNMSLYWQLIPCVRLRLRRFFSAEDPLGIRTQS